MIYGYIRVSTEQQNTINQKHEISTFADKNGLQIDKWMDETISSRKPLKAAGRCNRYFGKHTDSTVCREIKKIVSDMESIPSDSYTYNIDKLLSKVVNKGLIQRFVNFLLI